MGFSVEPQPEKTPSVEPTPTTDDPTNYPADYQHYLDVLYEHEQRIIEEDQNHRDAQAALDDVLDLEKQKRIDEEIRKLIERGPYVDPTVQYINDKLQELADYLNLKDFTRDSVKRIDEELSQTLKIGVKAANSLLFYLAKIDSEEIKKTLKSVGIDYVVPLLIQLYGVEFLGILANMFLGIEAMEAMNGIGDVAMGLVGLGAEMAGDVIGGGIDDAVRGAVVGLGFFFANNMPEIAYQFLLTMLDLRPTLLEDIDTITMGLQGMTMAAEQAIPGAFPIPPAATYLDGLAARLAHVYQAADVADFIPQIPTGGGYAGIIPTVLVTPVIVQRVRNPHVAVGRWRHALQLLTGAAAIAGQTYLGGR